MLDHYLKENLNPVFIKAVLDLENKLAFEKQNKDFVEAKRNLVRLNFNKLFEPLYKNHLGKFTGSVYLLSAIHPDGMGDYIQLLTCAKLIKDSFNGLDVHIVYTHKQVLPVVNFVEYGLKEENIHAFKETTRSILGEVLEGQISEIDVQNLNNLKIEQKSLLKEKDDLEKISPIAADAIVELLDSVNKKIEEEERHLFQKQEATILYEELIKSNLLIHISLAINTFDNPILKHKSCYFAEAGNFLGVADYLQRNWYSLGVGPFEEGFYLKTLKKDLNIKQIKNTYLAYIPRIPKQLDLYLEVIGKLQQKEKATVHIPKSAHVEESGILNNIDMELIKDLPLPPKEFYKLLQSVEDIVGCTGDCSFSEVLALGKIPFYEIRPHKMNMIQGFLQLTKQLFLPTINEYFENLILFTDLGSLTFADKIAKILSSNSFNDEWSTLLEFIRRYYCFEDHFISKINRLLLLVNGVELRKKEEEWIDLYIDEKISSEQAYKELENFLK